ncbi:hypothetical protein FRC06_002822 [Ceratobasidium sp. 370]|nr:hypothetical protein FRC06_002822 [Ceratobasidium sp. 370]
MHTVASLEPEATRSPSGENATDTAKRGVADKTRRQARTLVVSAERTGLLSAPRPRLSASYGLPQTHADGGYLSAPRTPVRTNTYQRATLICKYEAPGVILVLAVFLIYFRSLFAASFRLGAFELIDISCKMGKASDGTTDYMTYCHPGCTRHGPHINVSKRTQRCTQRIQLSHWRQAALQREAIPEPSVGTSTSTAPLHPTPGAKSSLLDDLAFDLEPPPSARSNPDDQDDTTMPNWGLPLGGDCFEYGAGAHEIGSASEEDLPALRSGCGVEYRYRLLVWLGSPAVRMEDSDDSELEVPITRDNLMSGADPAPPVNPETPKTDTNFPDALHHY